MDDSGTEIKEVLQSIAHAEVITIYFPSFRKTLLFDARTNEKDGPMVTVVDMVTSSDERFRSLKRLRPRFGRPESLVLIPWPRSIESLTRLGVLSGIIERCKSLGDASADETCQNAYKTLLELEHTEKIKAVLGEGYETLWQRDTGAAES